MPKASHARTGSREPQSGRELYERDEHEWIEAQIAALSDGRLNRLDRTNLIDWVSTIIEQQSEIRSIIQSILSLGRQADSIAAIAYPDAVGRAARETGLPAASFPSALPWTVASALVFDPPEPVAGGKSHQ
jgi:hypothetical protein